MSMSKRNYIEIADEFKRAGAVVIDPASRDWTRSDVCLYLAECLSDVFEHDNPRFDRARFLAACGVQS